MHLTLTLKAIKVDPSRIFCIMHDGAPDESGTFGEITPTTARFGENAANFLSAEMRRGLIPRTGAFKR